MANITHHDGPDALQVLFCAVGPKVVHIGTLSEPFLPLELLADVFDFTLVVFKEPKSPAIQFDMQRLHIGRFLDFDAIAHLVIVEVIGLVALAALCCVEVDRPGSGRWGLRRSRSRCRCRDGLGDRGGESRHGEQGEAE